MLGRLALGLGCTVVISEGGWRGLNGVDVHGSSGRGGGALRKGVVQFVLRYHVDEN